MKKYLGVILSLLCASCSGLVIPLDNIHSTSTTNVAFDFIDLRPSEEKIFSPSTVTQPFHNYGDKEFVPDRMEVLKSVLTQRLSQNLAGHRIEIKSFQFIAFIPGATRKYELTKKVGWLGGPLGVAVVSAFDDDPERDRFICSIEATVDGSPIAITDSEPIPGYLDLSPTKKAGNNLIHRMVQDFVSEVCAHLNLSDEIQNIKGSVTSDEMNSKPFNEKGEFTVNSKEYSSFNSKNNQVAEKLKDLKRMYRKELITKKEYDIKRKEIISEF